MFFIHKNNLVMSDYISNEMYNMITVWDSRIKNEELVLAEREKLLKEEKEINHQKELENEKIAEFEKKRKHEKELADKKKQLEIAQKKDEVKTKDVLKNILIEMSTRFQRLTISEITEELEMRLEKRATGNIVVMIENFIKDGIVHGKYFQSTRSIVFDVTNNDFTGKIDEQFSSWKNDINQKLK
jgi:hypothetical protein